MDLSFLCSFYSISFTLSLLFSQEIGFHFVFKSVSWFHISYVILDIITDLHTNVRKTYFKS